MAVCPSEKITLTLQYFWEESGQPISEPSLEWIDGPSNPLAKGVRNWVKDQFIFLNEGAEFLENVGAGDIEITKIVINGTALHAQTLRIAPLWVIKDGAEVHVNIKIKQQDSQYLDSTLELHSATCKKHPKTTNNQI